MTDWIALALRLVFWFGLAPIITWIAIYATIATLSSVVRWVSRARQHYRR